MIWNPGDDTDLNEGGGGADTVEVNGGNGAEQFTTTANGTRVRFDRLNPAPFAIDIGTSEKLVLNANGGDDSFSATGNLAALIAITVDGGAGNDTLLGSNGVDLLLGGDGNDFVDGQQGNDVGSARRRRRHASSGIRATAATWSRARTAPTRCCSTAATATRSSTPRPTAGACGSPATSPTSSMDLDDVESIVVKAFGGADNVTVNDLSGTDVADVVADLAAVGGGDDLAADNVIVNATNGDDVVTVTGGGPNAQVSGLAAARLGVRRDRRQRPADGQRAGRRRRRRRLRTGRHLRAAHGRRRRRRRRAHRRRRQRHARSAAPATTCCSAGRAPTRSTAGPATTSSSSPRRHAVTSATRRRERLAEGPRPHRQGQDRAQGRRQEARSFPAPSWASSSAVVASS